MNALAQRYGQWALVLGASDGTGAAFARRLATEGFSLFLVARNETKLAQLCRELAGDDIACEPIVADLAQPGAVETIRAAVGGRQVGLLVANAGADPNGSHFLDASLERWQDLMQVNIGTKLALVHHFGRAMRDRGRGGILLVGSGGCYGGGPYMSVYSGSKAFTLNFAESLWHELRPHGVDVLYMALSTTDTPSLRTLLSRNGQPVPENLADPDSVAALGLERLGEGPLLNWGFADDEAGYLPQSAAARRSRVEAIAQASARIFERE